MKASISIFIALVGSAMAATYTITWTDKRNEGAGNPQTFQCDEDVYILDAADDASLDWPYAQRSGIDATSSARLISGKADQSEQVFLNEEEIAAGYILYDVAYPRADCELIIGVEDELN
jgi:ferredoxin